MAFPKKEGYGSRNLREFASHVRQHVDDVTADPVHLRGSKTAVSQLPQSAPDGDIWYVHANGRFYVRANGAWKAAAATVRKIGTVLLWFVLPLSILTLADRTWAWTKWFRIRRRWKRRKTRATEE